MRPLFRHPARCFRNLRFIHALQSPRRPSRRFGTARCSSRHVTSVSELAIEPDDYAFVPIEDTEPVERYRPGGYHPVSIGHRLDDRYRVVHKLGHGTFSTTWLARDEQLQRYVAVKVGTADADSHEADVLVALASASPVARAAPGATMIPSLLDAFLVHGPHGKHPCLVTEPARCSVSESKRTLFPRLFHLQLARALAAQLAVAVAHVHGLGFVHGDLHLGNILLKLPRDFHLLSETELYSKWGPPRLEPVTHMHGKALPQGVPSYAVILIWLGIGACKLTLPDARILLVDFGEAFSPSKESRFESHAPEALRAPEGRFEPTEPLSFASDIWTMACSIWDIVAQRSLFDGFLTTEDNITCEQVDTLGMLPTEWWERWETRSASFTEDGRPTSDRPRMSLEDKFEDDVQQPRRRRGLETLELAERDALLAMLRSMLAFRPEQRCNASEVLESEWMTKWAMPEYEKIPK